MPKLLFSISLFFLITAASAQNKNGRSASKNAGAKSSEHSNAVKIGVNTFFDTDEFPFNIAWETKIGDNESLQLGILPRLNKDNGGKTSGIGFNVAFRKYISKNRTGIQGLFISPIIKAGFLSDTYSYSNIIYVGNPPVPQYYYYSSERKTSQYSVGLVFGHKWAYRSGFTFEASGGMGYYSSTDKTSNQKYTYSGILPQVQLSFGYTF